jgi:hypothetical protein
MIHKVRLSSRTLVYHYKGTELIQTPKAVSMCVAIIFRRLILTSMFLVLRNTL